MASGILQVRERKNNSCLIYEDSAKFSCWSSTFEKVGSHRELTSDNFESGPPGSASPAIQY